MGDGIPTDQLSHNHCDCSVSHCNSHSVASCVFVFPFNPSPISSPSAAEAAQRLRRDEEVLDAPEELRQPVVGVGGTQEVHRQERLALYTWWISQDSHVPWSSCCGTRVSSGLIARQMEEPEEQRKKSRAGRGSVCNLARQSH